MGREWTVCTSLANLVCVLAVNAELGNILLTMVFGAQCSVTGSCKTRPGCESLGGHAVQASEKVHLPGLRPNIPLIKWKQPTSLLSRKHKAKLAGAEPTPGQALSPQGHQQCRRYLKLPTWMDREASALGGRPGVSALESARLLCVRSAFWLQETEAVTNSVTAMGSTKVKGCGMTSGDQSGEQVRTGTPSVACMEVTTQW